MSRTQKHPLSSDTPADEASPASAPPIAGAITGVIAALALGIAGIDARALIWLLPVGLPLLLAIPLTVLTSQASLGRTLRANRYLLIPEESNSPVVLRQAWLHARRLARPLLPVA